MNEQTISFELLIHPDEESMRRRDNFLSSMENDVSIIRMNSDGIIAEINLTL